MKKLVLICLVMILVLPSPEKKKYVLVNGELMEAQPPIMDHPELMEMFDPNDLPPIGGDTRHMTQPLERD